MMVKVVCNRVPHPLDPATRQPKTPGQQAQDFNRIRDYRPAPVEHVWANATGPKRKTFRCTRCASEAHDVVGKALV